MLREIGTDQEEAAYTLGASPLANVLARDVAGHPLGRDLRRRPDHGALAGRVRRGQRRQRTAVGQDRDAHPVRRGALQRVRPGRRIHGGRGAGDDRDRRAAGHERASVGPRQPSPRVGHGPARDGPSHPTDATGRADRHNRSHHNQAEV